jgi:hypothetical protein
LSPTLAFGDRDPVPVDGDESTRLCLGVDTMMVRGEGKCEQGARVLGIPDFLGGTLIVVRGDTVKKCEQHGLSHYFAFLTVEVRIVILVVLGLTAGNKTRRGWTAVMALSSAGANHSSSVISASSVPSFSKAPPLWLTV